MKVIGMEHVAVTSPPELEVEVLTWYRECLQLPEITKPEGTRAGGGWFGAGNQQVHVSIDLHNPPKTAHFGLVVDDFGDIVDRLRSTGCHIEQASSIPGRHRFYTRDPAGNRIEIITFDDVEATVEFEERSSEDLASVRAEES